MPTPAVTCLGKRYSHTWRGWIGRQCKGCGKLHASSERQAREETRENCSAGKCITEACSWSSLSLFSSFTLYISLYVGWALRAPVLSCCVVHPFSPALLMSFPPLTLIQSHNPVPHQTLALHFTFVPHHRVFIFIWRANSYRYYKAMCSSYDVISALLYLMETITARLIILLILFRNVWLIYVSKLYYDCVICAFLFPLLKMWFLFFNWRNGLTELAKFMTL